MEYTPQEVAKLLANRPHQPHYVEWLLEQCLKRERFAERERLAKRWDGRYWDGPGECCVDIGAAIRAGA